MKPELQIRGGIEDNSKIFFFLFLNKNICCDPDGSEDESQNMFLWRSWLIIPELSQLPLLTWTPDVPM